MEILDIIGDILLTLILGILCISSLLVMIDIHKTQKKSRDLDKQFEKVIRGLEDVLVEEQKHLEKMKKATKKPAAKRTKKAKVKAE